MHQTSVPERSTVDLIDELEARIAAIRGRNGHAVVAVAGAVGASELRAERHKLINGHRAPARESDRRTHPFSRIEDL